MCALNFFMKVVVALILKDVTETLKGTDDLILGSNLFVESVIDLTLKSAVWQLCISRLTLFTI